MTPTRPALRYHGGKWRLAPFVIAHIPPHRVYVEPFGGAASVLLRKPRAYAEIYNDLDGEIVALFEVLRDPERAGRLRELVALTPYARSEFERSYEPTDDKVEQARRTLIRSWLAHGSSGLRGHRTGFRLGSMREGSTPAADWRGFPEAIPAIVERLRGVYIERRPASQIIARHDGCDTLFYCDPPYLHSTRSQKRRGNDLYHGYRHELDDQGHRDLLAQLVGLKGMVVLSGYASDLYRGGAAGVDDVHHRGLRRPRCPHRGALDQPRRRGGARRQRPGPGAARSGVRRGGGMMAPTRTPPPRSPGPGA